jgi:hypothetical protein
VLSPCTMHRLLLCPLLLQGSSGSLASFVIVNTNTREDRRNSASPRQLRKNRSDLAPIGTLRTLNGTGEDSSHSPDLTTTGNGPAFSLPLEPRSSAERENDATLQGSSGDGKLYFRHMDGGAVVELPPSYVDGPRQMTTRDKGVAH